MNLKASISELIGTFALIFIGAGAAAIGGELIVVALAHGMVIIGLAYAYGHHSGRPHNNTLLGLITFGEGFHFNHHHDESKSQWSKLDIGGWIIRGIRRAT